MATSGEAGKDRMDYFQPLRDLNLDDSNVTYLAMAVVGMIYCFLGYRMLKFTIALTGFLLAGAVAAGLAGIVSASNLPITAIAGIIGGICGAMAFFFIFRAGIFCVGMLGASLAAYAAFTESTASWTPLAVLGIGLVGGMFALLIERPVITVATSTLGAALVVFAAGSMWFGPDLLATLDTAEFITERRIGVGVWFLLTVAGCMAQFASYRPKAKTPAPQPPG